MQLSVDSVGLPRDLPPGWGLLLALSRAIDAVNRFLGRGVMWLILAAILVSAGNAIIRKAFDISSNAWLELQWYLFGWAFLVAASYTLQRNEHIRIDILSNALLEADPQLDRHPRPHLHAAAVHGADDLSQLAVLLPRLSIRVRCPAAPAV